MLSKMDSHIQYSEASKRSEKYYKNISHSGPMSLLQPGGICLMLKKNISNVIIDIPKKDTDVNSSW